MLKTDGEPSVIVVQEAVSRNRAHDTLFENRLSHDAQGDGEAERAVAEVKAQMHARSKDRIGVKNKKEDTP